MYLFVCLCIWSINQWSDLFVIAVHDLQSFGLDNVSNPTDVSSLTDLWFRFLRKHFVCSFFLLKIPRIFEKAWHSSRYKSRISERKTCCCYPSLFNASCFQTTV